MILIYSCLGVANSIPAASTNNFNRLRRFWGGRLVGGIEWEMIEVSAYKEKWKSDFENLKSEIWPLVKDHALSIEHVGSTSVSGLSAKPVIDIDIVFSDRENLAQIVSALGGIGYHHVGDLGIKDREAFKKDNAKVKHNLYACLEGCVSLKNHLILRDHLRRNPDDCKKYSDLKCDLARQFPNDIDAYIEGKTKFILDVLGQYEIDSQNLADIKRANQKPTP